MSVLCDKLHSEVSQERWTYKASYINVEGRCESETKEAERKLSERIVYWWTRFQFIECIFVHIPKNAGTSVEEMLIGHETVPQSQHFTSRELKQQNPTLYSKLFRFCIIRNSYDRLLSAYEYLLNGGNMKSSGTDIVWQRKLLELGSFDAFVTSYFSSGEPNWRSVGLPGHFIPQYVFICDENDVIDVNYCIPFDSFTKHGLSPLLDNGLSAESANCLHIAPLAASDLESPPVPHLRKNVRHRNIGYDSAGVIANLVYIAYKKDFDLLGFDKDSWRCWMKTE